VRRRDAAANGNGDDAHLGTCAKHLAERAAGRCDDCHDVFCKNCLVPPLRKRQPTRCVDCALVAAGVRAPGPRSNAMMNMSRSNKRPNAGLF
jgi:hypothetical protein